VLGLLRHNLFNRLGPANNSMDLTFKKKSRQHYWPVATEVTGAGPVDSLHTILAFKNSYLPVKSKPCNGKTYSSPILLQTVILLSTS